MIILGFLQIFGGGCSSKFSGGGSGPGVFLQILGGGVPPNFQWGCFWSQGGGVPPNFLGGLQKFFFFFFQFLFPKKILLGCINPHPSPPPETVNARPVRILLECILVVYLYCWTRILIPIQTGTANQIATNYNMQQLHCTARSQVQIPFPTAEYWNEIGLGIGIEICTGECKWAINKVASPVAWSSNERADRG